MLQNQVMDVVNKAYLGDRFVKVLQTRPSPYTGKKSLTTRGRLFPSLDALIEAEQFWIRDHEEAVEKFGCAGSTRPCDDPTIAVVQIKVRVVGQVVDVDLQALNKHIDPVW